MSSPDPLAHRTDAAPAPRASWTRTPWQDQKRDDGRVGRRCRFLGTVRRLQKLDNRER